jgi:superfamily I DNA/RNA helicase
MNELPGSPPLINTYDSILKRAQLLKSSKIPCTALLVDESQDLNECQIEWVCSQISAHGIQLYIVGDAVQTIYSFRGAKSTHLMGIQNTIPNTISLVDRQLTQVWRFRPEIAAVANIILIFI